ncbi:MAG: zinc ABC transporter substrate-binding protein [Proteobacteria bacterium]|nr:zinc ABC transporter substrate-binding protein [Pseudomonadota bacterium]MCP4916230.1 zinc ABC transporter substrate-binding protein [Pseudomonadota bacterium]
MTWIWLLACSGEPEAPTSPKESRPENAAALRIVTTDWPTHYLVERLGADSVDATCILPAGESADTWQPSGDVVASLNDADLILTNGAGYAAWMKTASLPVTKVVELSSGVDLIELDGQTHSHGTEGEHSHGGLDPHTWMDPNQYLTQAGVVRAVLTVHRPDRATEFEARLTLLEVDLSVLDGQLAAATRDLAGVSIAQNHPAFNYLGRRYEVPLTTVEMSPTEVADVHLHESVILWEEAPTDEVKATLLDAQHVVLDALESGEPYDYVKQASANVAALADIVPDEPPAGSPVP